MAFKSKWLVSFVAGIGLLSGAHAATPSPDSLNVLLIVVDTLAAKHLSAYSNDAARTPNLDALAKSGVVFSNSYAVSPWTKPSIDSIFTSRYPYKHGVIGPSRKLPEELTTLGEIFKSRNFLTAAFTSHIYLSRNSGLAQGFDEFRQLNANKGLHNAITGEKVSSAAIEWLGRNAGKDSKNKFFLFLHYFDPHFRYMRHPEFDRTSGYRGPLRPGMSVKALLKRRSTFTKEDIRYLSDLYREEIEYTDRQIGRVIDELGTLGLRERTLVVLTADHGEEFMEHGGLTHIQSLFDELIRIPLLASLPGVVAPRVVKAPVSQLDILPTLAALSGTPSSHSPGDGISLLPVLFEGKGGDETRELYAEVSYVSSKRPNPAPHILGIRSGRYKLIHDLNTKRKLLFDLETDPAERADISKTAPDVMQRLGPKLDNFKKAHLAAIAKKKRREDEMEISPEDLKSLKSLGYL